MSKFHVPEPDEMDIWVHNYDVLGKARWVIVVLGGWAIYTEAYLILSVLALIWVGLKGMSRLLCGWVHAWAQIQIQHAKFTRSET